MKLLELQKIPPLSFNRERQSLKNHLALDVRDRGAVINEMYIISDIPSIDEKKFDKLWDLSFGTVPPKQYLSILRYDPNADEGLFPLPEDFEYTYDSIQTMKWKKFVHTMQNYYEPYYDDQDEGDDDFDE